ncbi:secretin and TonB N-terminal domain-containing protein [Hydrogenivirga sp. 128-5-R1-1]|uniref:secretin and TonB N-terminal domain-containing protein n=1 Tax=Hydrogenivirga sp. 128-5-R1-1 TaxID=392423 RepID=UPI00015F372C|nr:secretin and TonB N-terminal domain-containing protein [Hydrogenivirga sp. 128-5-R1-1]EDP76668.1 putative type II secretion system protein [Hydrogenivirga sp. 128-5-R1-1]
MVKGFGVVLLLISSVLLSCAQKSEEVDKTAKAVSKEIENKRIEVQRQSTTPPPPADTPPPILAPTYREIDPFEGKTFSMSAVSAPLTKVLYAIADGSGLNLIVSPEVDVNRTITATFNNVPMKEALEIIMDMTGLYYEVRGNVLYVKEFMTKTFRIPYIHTTTNFNSSLGGDVLGGALTSGGTYGTATTGVTAGTTGGIGATGLRGNFTLDYKNPEGANDLYKQLEENVKNMLSKEGKFVLNRFTGTLVVTDRRRNVERIERFVKGFVRKIGKQVLIEAKIVEIALSDVFQYGIDWSTFFRDVFGTGANVTLSQTLSIPTGGFFSLNVVSSDFSTLVNALATYGKVYTLSNPRIMVSNGQTALIATGIVTPFFERQAVTITGTTTTQIQENIVKTNVLEGVLLGVTPYIDDNGSIVMNIIPVATRLEGSKTLEVNGQVLAEAPILNIKETGTIVRVRNGELVVIGGLIGDVRSVQERKVPGLGDIPVLGYLFKSKRTVKEKRELIIFLRPRIIDNIGL